MVGWIFFGLCVGVVAKLLLSGRDPGGFIVTILLGIAGGFPTGWEKLLRTTVRETGRLTSLRSLFHPDDLSRIETRLPDGGLARRVKAFAIRPMCSNHSGPKQVYGTFSQALHLHNPADM